jgi:hypothetical protein
MALKQYILIYSNTKITSDSKQILKTLMAFHLSPGTCLKSQDMPMFVRTIIFKQLPNHQNIQF